MRVKNCLKDSSSAYTISWQIPYRSCWQVWKSAGWGVWAVDPGVGILISRWVQVSCNLGGYCQDMVPGQCCGEWLHQGRSLLHLWPPRGQWKRITLTHILKIRTRPNPFWLRDHFECDVWNSKDANCSSCSVHHPWHCEIAVCMKRKAVLDLLLRLVHRLVYESAHQWASALHPNTTSSLLPQCSACSWEWCRL